MSLSIIAAMGIGKAIRAVQMANPTAYEGFKQVIGVAGMALSRLSDVLEDDKIDAGEIDNIIDDVQDSGAGRLVVGLIMGALSKIR